MRRLLLLLLAVLALVPATADAAGGKTLKARPSRFGTMLTDARGLSLYLFTRDAKGPSRCYSACARAWPPLITSGRPRAGKGVKSRLLGTTRRRDGRRQVTYKGQPLYYYVGEDEAGEVLCQNVFEFDGTWLVVAPSGAGIR